jgi:hypothetical protein
MGKIQGRAQTPEEKKAVIGRILRAWEANPSLRLGQLIANSVGPDIYNTEDLDLASLLETYSR